MAYIFICHPTKQTRLPRSYGLIIACVWTLFSGLFYLLQIAAKSKQAQPRNDLGVRYKNGRCQINEFTNHRLSWGFPSALINFYLLLSIKR